MAVQKSKKSRSKRDKRRNSNTIFKIPTLSIDKETGETHIRHFMTKTGFYKGKQVINIKKNKKLKNIGE
jgi:large subunit ribosomal protein L32